MDLHRKLAVFFLVRMRVRKGAEEGGGGKEMRLIIYARFPFE